jgi:hypothetical protein
MLSTDRAMVLVWGATCDAVYCTLALWAALASFVQPILCLSLVLGVAECMGVCVAVGSATQGLHARLFVRFVAEGVGATCAEVRRLLLLLERDMGKEGGTTQWRNGEAGGGARKGTSSADAKQTIPRGDEKLDIPVEQKESSNEQQHKQQQQAVVKKGDTCMGGYHLCAVMCVLHTMWEGRTVDLPWGTNTALHCILHMA